MPEKERKISLMDEEEAPSVGKPPVAAEEAEVADKPLEELGREPEEPHRGGIAVLLKSFGQGHPDLKRALLIFLGLVVGGGLVAGLIFTFGGDSDYDIISGLRGEGSKSVSSSGSGSLGEGGGTVPAPLSGVLLSEERVEIVRARRPLAIMINNHVDARPQFGLSLADIVYEVVAEGGITRFMAVFHTQDVAQVGPVRSARVYYLQLAAELAAWYAHWGGAYQDLNDASVTFPEADSYAYLNQHNLPSLDQMWLGETAYWRDTSRGVALEHTGYTSTDKLWAEAPNRYPEPDWHRPPEIGSWLFKDEEVGESERPAEASCSFNFWDIQPAFAVKWEYDPATNEYVRYQGEVKQVDALNDQEIRAKTAILQFTTERAVGDQKDHLLYDIIGSGKARILMDGEVSEVTWSKDGLRSRTRYYDAFGSEFTFNRGQIWVEIIPTGNEVTCSVSDEITNSTGTAE